MFTEAVMDQSGVGEYIIADVRRKWEASGMTRRQSFDLVEPIGR